MIILGALAGCSPTVPDESLATSAPVVGTTAGGCEFAATRKAFDPEHPQNTALSYVKLANTGTTDCEVSGFPDVALLDANGNVVGDPAVERTTVPARTLTVKPKQAAYVILKVAGQNLYQDCPLLGAATLRIRLPQSSEDIHVDVADLNICDGATSRWLVYNLAASPDNPHS
ncbi:hypothetical protein B7495_18240 (plasmid) [Cryobacterium sp. LW097]|uniref:DUF4232 domain-containing protein n=1 Tax=unclassified Cryobacterium TaxID=2649013 RepID=UPI000B4D207A|nr:MULTISPECIES: DUF4232 domain-containing protein [unclassified Cryobacterium]ASD24224.1 hypothetical protein B7495_18240 [Cryobacterium sp. LW097]